ncbi:unnamed protein product [Arabis nemorensis]|uniref:Uncharacterized protein n=1 Tax=Arabis nemorensis TaxID=586526 RepID=A0A565CDH2_9BRAS|nr:unnamed protein product [Arabis nemorensis]
MELVCTTDVLREVSFRGIEHQPGLIKEGPSLRPFLVRCCMAGNGHAATINLLQSQNSVSRTCGFALLLLCFGMDRDSEGRQAMEEYKVTCGSFDIAVRVGRRTFWDISKIGPTRRLIRCTTWQPLLIVPPSAPAPDCEDYNTLNSCATCLFWWRRPWWPLGMFLPPKRM